MEKIRKPPSFNAFDAGNYKAQTPGAQGREAPSFKPKGAPAPRASALVTAQQGFGTIAPAAAERPAFDAKDDAGLPGPPSHKS